MYCVHCGKLLSADVAFCPNCGKSIANHIKQPQRSDIPVSEEAQKNSVQLSPEYSYSRYDCSVGTDQIPLQQPGESDVYQPEDGMKPHASSAQSFSGISQITAVTKHKKLKWIPIAVCAFAVLLIALLVLVLTKPEGVKPADTIPQSSVSKPAVTPEIPSATETPQQTDVQPKEGECLYVGYGTYFDIDSLKLSFILSADKSYIYGVKIAITNLNTNLAEGNTNTNIKISTVNESFPGQYPVDYKNGTDVIDLGTVKILNLYFDGAAARFELDYTYIYRGTGMDSQETEIPFGTTLMEMVTEDETEMEPANTATAFDENKLQNWNDKAIKKTFRVSNVREFVPSSPVQMYYIVCTDGVYDPVTGKESEGGYNQSYSRHLPISTNEMLRTSGNLKDGGLTLTDDPNKATYALILNYSYENNVGSFHFNEDDSTIPQYHATLDAELLNLVTKESIYSQTKDGYATYANESVYSSMLDNAKGKQLYGGPIFLYADDFDGYWYFVNN